MDRDHVPINVVYSKRVTNVEIVIIHGEHPTNCFTHLPKVAASNQWSQDASKSINQVQESEKHFTADTVVIHRTLK